MIPFIVFIMTVAITANEKVYHPLTKEGTTVCGSVDAVASCQLTK